MTLEELREACAKAAESLQTRSWSCGDQGNCHQTDNALDAAADAIRAIPLPAPVDDEPSVCSTHQRPRIDCATCNPALRERNEARTELLRVRDVLEEFNNRSQPESACVLEMAQTLRTRRQERDASRAEVAGLTAALAAAQRERDEARSGAAR